MRRNTFWRARMGRNNNCPDIIIHFEIIPTQKTGSSSSSYGSSLKITGRTPSLQQAICIRSCPNTIPPSARVVACKQTACHAIAQKPFEHLFPNWPEVINTSPHSSFHRGQSLEKECILFPVPDKTLFSAL